MTVDDELLARARAMVNGAVPSKTRLQKELGIGWDRATEIHPILLAEHPTPASGGPAPVVPGDNPEPSREDTPPSPTDPTDPTKIPPESHRRTDWRKIGTYVLVAVACAVASAGALAVTAAGFALSFDAIRAVAVAAYVNQRIAWMMPVAIDGAMAVAMVTAVVLRWAGRSPAYPWSIVIAGAAVSVACNAAHASIEGGLLRLPTYAAMAVSGIPAASVAASVHMLIVLAVAVVQPKGSD